MSRRRWKWVVSWQEDDECPVVPVEHSNEAPYPREAVNVVAVVGNGSGGADGDVMDSQLDREVREACQERSESLSACGHKTAIPDGGLERPRPVPGTGR